MEQIIEPIEYNGERVLTTLQVAALFGVKVSTLLSRTYSKLNKFEEGVHYFRMQGAELSKLKAKYTESFSYKGKGGCPIAFLWTKRGIEHYADKFVTAKGLEVLKWLNEEYFVVSKPEPVGYLNVPAQIDLRNGTLTIDLSELLGFKTASGR